MKLQQVVINNFHCFDKATFEFGDRVTVLIGKNGSGKSSLIKAIRNALSVFFTNSYSQWEIDSIVGNVADLKVANLKTREIWHDNDMRPAASAKIEMEVREPEFNWSFVKSSAADAKVQSSFYRDAFIRFRKSYGDKESWPLFAYYSDRFPHIDAKLGDSVKKMIRNDLQLYRAWGYYHWDKDDSCALIWQKRFMRIFNLQLKRLRRLEKIEDKESTEAKMCKEEVNRYKGELEFVVKYLRNFTDSNVPDISDASESIKITDLIVDGDDDDSYLVAYFADGKRRRWDELPAGYERLYNIVFDIAYRSYILNGDAAPQGIVMVDELDLHLHPTMEQDVLRRLTSTFPNIQFIISTHSPLVIGNSQFGEDGEIVLLRHEGDEYNHVSIDDPFGLDYDIILSAIMDTEPRNIKLQMLKEKYKRLMRRGKTEKAKSSLDEIENMLSKERFQLISEELSKQLEEEI